jgi:hypothetical protein
MGASRSLTPSGGLDVALPYRPSVNIPLGNMAPGRDPVANYAIPPRVSYDYLFGARNDDKPYVSPYDVARYGSVSSGPGLLPSKEFGGYPGARPEAKLASTLLAGGAGALDAVVSPAYGLGTGLLDYLSGGTPDDFMNSYAGGYRDANAIFQPFETLDPAMYGKGANAATVASVAYGMPGVMGPTRAAAEAAAAARASAAARAGAGIDAVIPQTARLPAALTPREAQFRQLMDSLNADPANAALATPRPVSAGPRVTPGGGQPVSAMSPAEMDILERIVGNLGTRTQRDAVRSTSNVYDDTLNSALENALGVGPTVARAEQLTPRAPFVPAGEAAGREAYRKALAENYPGIQALLDNPPAVARLDPARGDELFPDINPAATISDPMDVFGPQLPALPRQLINSYPTPTQWMGTVGPRRITDTPQSPFVNSYPDMLDLVGPQRPDFMFPDEAADVVLRGGPRVDATPRRFTPTAAGVRSIIGAGAGIPLALLPFADLPSGGGIDAVERGGVGPSAKLDQMVKTPTGADITRADRARMRQGYGEASQLAAKAVAEKRDAEWASLPNADPAAGVDRGTVKVRDGVPVKRNEFGAIVPVVDPFEPRLAPDPGFVPSVLPDNYSVDSDVPVVEADVPKVIPVGTSETDAMVKDAEAAFMDPAEVAKREAATNKPESEFGSYTRFPSGSAGDEADAAAPAAGTKFTPGPGQFVGTNGYIYEQSSDGSFENVGRVPGYTPAQLSEAANKGAFRDPNNIVTGGAKPRKQVKKKGEKNFIDKAGDILKERFDDSLFARLFLNQDDDAAAEDAAADPEAVEYYSTPPASVPESLVSSSGSSKKRKPKDETDTGTGTGGTGTGTGGTGTSPYTPEVQAMLNALYGNYMRQYNGPGVGYVPGVDPERNYFTPAFADGGLVDGRLVLGDGGPKEDKIPAMIDGVEQAKLSNGEFVMTAAAVKNAGGGDIELGAKRLMDLNNMLSYGKPADRLKVQHVK